MACYHRILAYRGEDGVVRFHKQKGGEAIELPCGQCVGCRLQRARDWAVRCVHESQLHDQNSYITLTYDDLHVPDGHSLRYSDFQSFMRRLRLHVRREDRKLKRTPRRVRFFMSGEYGDDKSRPHFHALLFGYDFPEQVVCAKKGGHELFRSPLLERLWPFGFSSIGRVTFESAAYVARYVMKKVTGDLARDHYRVVDPATGEIIDRVPEFCHMSLKPGIGGPWLDRFFLMFIRTARLS